jgi:hypothetical protein
MRDLEKLSDTELDAHIGFLRGEKERIRVELLEAIAVEERRIAAAKMSTVLSGLTDTERAALVAEMGKPPAQVARIDGIPTEERVGG